MKILIKKLAKIGNSIGIVPKIVIPQCITIILFLVFSIPLVYRISYYNTNIAAASNGYNFATLSISNMETQLHQIRATANYIASNPLVLRLMTNCNTVEEFQELYNRVQDTFVSYEYNRGRAHTINFYASSDSCEIAQSALPIWYPTSDHMVTAEYSKAVNEWTLFKEEHNNSAAHLILSQHLYQKGTRVGTVQIESGIDLLTELTDFFKNILRCEFIIFDEGQNIFFQSDNMTQEIRQVCLENWALPEGYSVDAHCIVYSLHFRELSMKIIAIQPINTSLSFQATDTRIIIVAVIFLTLCMLLSVCLYLTITHRIVRLSNHMSQVSDLSKLQLQQVKGNDEIAKLTDSYNQMLTRIKDYAQAAQNAEILQQRAEYDTLQAQIQPHFLYNTLETLRMMAEENDDEQVADMICLFGRFLRNTISHRDQKTCIRQELESVKDYLTLYQLRMPTLSYFIKTAPETMDINCPRFIIQPLVENAIKHGLRKSTGPGFLCIEVYIKDNFLYVDVTNSGKKMTIERMQELNAMIAQNIPTSTEGGISTGLGLNNVHSRLQIYFGEQSGISFKIDSQGRTVCRLTMRLST